MSEINPFIVALDVDSPKEALKLAERLKGEVGGFKVGPRIVLRCDPELLRRISECGPLFVDNKYFDIPSVMAAAVRATFDCGATWTTVHALSGLEAMRELAALERELSKIRPFHILAVTILTSFSQATLPLELGGRPLEERVMSLVKLAHEGGLSSVVCSAHEVGKIHRLYPKSLLVTPGIRLLSDEKGDQKRVMTPGEALREGASLLVVGRPVVEAQDPLQAIRAFRNDVARVHSGL